MSHLAKKITAIITVLTISVWVAGPNVAQAQLTIEELLAQITALQAQLLQLQAQLAQIQPGGAVAAPSACSGISSFDSNLSQGDSGNNVKCLQAILNQSADTQVAASGVGSSGNETTYFGPLTKAAVVKFQEKYTSEILTPNSLTAGTGFVGPSTRAKLNSLLTTAAPPAEEEEEEEVPPPAAAGENKIELTADTPAASSVAKGALDVVFAKVNFCAGAEANTVSKIIVTRAGIANDSDMSSIKLYDGTTQVGNTQAINSTTHKATFASLNWTIAANSCKVLTVQGSIATGATQGNTVKLSINAASDITSTTALDGVFPIASNGKTVAGISTGALQVATTTPSGGTVVAGGIDESIAGFNFTASSSEGVNVNSIILTEIGSSVDSDVSNIKLWYGTTQIGSTVASLTNGKATFDLSAAPLALLGGQTKALKVTVDIGTSVGIQNRTIGFEMTDDTRVTAYGANSGGKITVFGRTWASTFPVNSAVATINLGTLTIAQDTGNSPASQDYTKGTTQNSLIAFKFTSGSNEGTRITQVKLTRSDSNLADSSVSNITLYDASTGEQLKDTAGNLVGAAGQVSGIVTFGSYTTGLDTTGLFDIVKSQNKIIIVKADVPSGAATGTAVLGYKINDPTIDIKADGLSSQNDLASSDINAGSATAVPSTVLEHNIIAEGTLTVQSSSGTPAAATYAVGTNDIIFAKFDFITTGEDINVSQLKILFSTSSDVTATTTAADAADVINIEILDGDTVLKTDSTLSSGQAEFGLNLTVTKNTTKTLTVRADIPAGSDAGNLTAHIDSAAYVTATGQSSAQTITSAAASWSVRGNLMTKGTPTLTVIPAQTPSAKTFIKNDDNAHVATLYFTASAAENISVTKIRISADSTSSASISSFSALADATDTDAAVNLVGNLKLFDGTTQVGSTMPTLTGAAKTDYVDFSGLALVISKGQTKALDVKVKILNSTGTEYFYFGVATASDITATGVQSGTSATVTAKDGANQGSAGKGMLLSGGGTLAVANDVSRTKSAVVIASGAGQTAGSWKFTASNEGISITKLVFDVTHSSVATGTSDSAVNLPNRVHLLPTASTVTTTLAFNYSINDGATATCYFWWGALSDSTTADNLISVLNSAASSSCSTAIQFTTSTGNVLRAAASTTKESIEITDFGTTASNSADNLQIGLKYGGTETIGLRAGNDKNVLKVSLYDGATKLSDGFIGANRSGKVEFGCDSCATLATVNANSSKILTLKMDISDYTNATSGSSIIFALGNATAASDTDYIAGKGASSGTSLATSTILTAAGGVGAITALQSNEMFLHATVPTVSLNSSSPSGAKAPSSNGEVFRFDVTVPAYGFDVNINAIRFSISSNATATVWDKNYNLYKSTDLATVIGLGSSFAAATTTGTAGWVAIYPETGNTVGSGSTITYVLKANTSQMDTNPSTNQVLTISIEDSDFFWDDGLANNANRKVPGLPVTGGTLSF